MAFQPFSPLFAGGLVGGVSRAVYGMFEGARPTAYSPEAALLNQPLRDPRLAPKVPMSPTDIDSGTLAALSKMGMKRGKLITHESHPELMAGWEAMAQRAGIPAPQLIIAENKVPNAGALMIHKPAQEVVMTTGLLQRLDLRETLAVLGHELGHAKSDHTTPRVVASLGLGLLGVSLSLALGRFLRIGDRIDGLMQRTKVTSWVSEHVFGRTHGGMGLLESSGYFMGGLIAGNTVAAHLTVRPTELDADAKGAQISTDPQGLAMALQHLESYGQKQGPVKRMLAKILSGYPSTEERISRLETMHAQTGSQPLAASVPVGVAPMPQAVVPAPVEMPPVGPVTQVAGAQHESRLAVGEPMHQIA